MCAGGAFGGGAGADRGDVGDVDGNGAVEESAGERGGGVVGRGEHVEEVDGGDV